MNKSRIAWAMTPDASGTKGGPKESDIQEGVKEEAKRYNLVLPTSLYNRIEAIAKEDQTTVLETLRRFIRLGIIARDFAKDPESQLLVRQGEEIREIIFL